MTILCWFPPQCFQSRCSPQTHTKPRSILEYSSRIHTCHWLCAQWYWGSIWTPPYHSTSTASMWQREYQVGTTSLRPWQVLHGDNKRKHYWWLTRQAADRSSITPHLFGVHSKPTWHQLQKNPIHTKWGSLRDVTRCPV